MALPRVLRHPPIQEAVMQFEFEGTPLELSQLESLASRYVAEGWERMEVHNLQTTLEAGTAPVAMFTAKSALFGLVVRNVEKQHLVQLRPNVVAASNARPYESWEVLASCAELAFNRFVETARPNAVARLSARFVNRIPSFAELTEFEQILERPPLPLADLPGANVSDFLRRHVITGLEDGFSANLTIGTVAKEAGEDPGGKALVIDTDVFKLCHTQPNFNVFRSDLATLRSIKNKLFFGSLKDAVVEKFV
jgi:uncharacterized protein (TIGR04255 family)